MNLPQFFKWNCYEKFVYLFNGALYNNKKCVVPMSQSFGLNVIRLAVRRAKAWAPIMVVLEQCLIRAWERFFPVDQHIFYIFIDCRGRHWKGISICNADKVNLQQKLWFHWTKVYLWKLQQGKNTNKWSYIVDNISLKISNIKLNINDVCNLIKLAI